MIAVYKKFFLMLGVTVLLCLSASVVWSADFQKGLAAAQKGDFATALREWKPFAELGNAVAQYNLGLMYLNGNGVLQNYKNALKWFRLSAEQGYAASQNNLAVMYVKGEGVIQDNIYAHMWWNISASNGDKLAAKNREIVAKKMTAADISAAQKLARECVKKKYKGC